MTVYAITDTKKGRTEIAPTYLQTTLSRFHLIPERYGQTDRQTDRQTDLLYQYRASVC